MWFKHLYLYRVHDTAPLPLETLTDALDAQRFRPLAAHEAKRNGWVPPAGRGSDRLIHEIQGHRLVRLAEQQRLLPASVINEALEERCADLEAQQGFPPRRREKQALKDTIIEELLPQAFARTTVTDLWWDTERRLIGVSCASSKRAESVLDALRQTLGSLKVTPLAAREPIARTMTTWLTTPESRPATLTLGDQLELRGNDDGILRARAMDLEGEEIQTALAAGRLASKLALHIEEQLSFTLQEDLALKSLRFSDALIDEAHDTDDGGDASLKLDTEFALMTHVLADVIHRLIDWLGGELDPSRPHADTTPN